jgi:DNA polymerase III epsilon subunit-like protein
MRILVIDTETSGLPNYAAPADDPSQPRLAQFGGFVLQQVQSSPHLFNEVDHIDYLVRPDGWEMTDGATAVNGLTTERLLEHGLPVRALLDWYSEKIALGCTVVSYNAQHDCKVMRGELRRAGMDDLFEATRNICLMRACGKLGIEKANGKRGWPSLSDVCRHFEIAQTEQHTALGDANAHVEIFLKLHAAGLLPEAEVHYAKNPPTKQAALDF